MFLKQIGGVHNRYLNGPSKRIFSPLISFLLVAPLVIIQPLNSFPVAAQSQPPNPPCGDSYGSPETRRALERALYSGTLEEVYEAFKSAKEFRGNRVGCPDTAATYTAPDLSEPSLEEIVHKWENEGWPAVNSFNSLSCPLPARGYAGNAVAAYYARLAGYTAELPKLAEIANDFEAQQYSAKYAPLTPAATYPGVFGFLAPPDPCAIPDPTFSVAITQICTNRPSLCVLYTEGPYAGRRWLVGDIVPEAGIFDGGMAYDHAWAGVMMIESTIQQTDPILKEKFRQSAELAGDWAIAEPAVRNHNYTAKLIWLLAELYGWQGQAKWRAGLLEKVNRSLINGPLMDLDGDGLVDGMDSQPFSGLTYQSQIAGRVWDGHNARGVYQAMNAWAMVEAYVAFRDRGDDLEAARLRPYAIAMLDNLAWEVNNLGTGAGKTQPPFAILLGLYKIADYENDPHEEWEKAANALWNAGVTSTSSTPPAIGTFDIYTVAMYLLRRAGPGYVPLEQREGRPDLIVSNIIATQDVPKETTLTATISNIGSAAANKVLVRFEREGIVIGDGAPVVRLAKGASTDISFVWNSRSLNGDHVITAMVDPDHTIVELNELNNTAKRTITIRGNKVKNGSFEQSDDDGPTGWSGSQGTGYDTSGVHASDGTCSVSVTGSGDGANLADYAWTSAPIAVTGGRTYDLAMTFKSQGLSTSPTLQVVYLDAVGSLLGSIPGISSHIIGDSVPQQVLGRITIPSGVSQVQLRLSGFSANDTEGGMVWFDDVWLW